ncbi:MAG TPA: hypothetical protein VMB91_09960 [Solirubrobacteraceae bacterium]|nr:hypothetical protein [Solirubrobacteraceae bacterium]
MCGGADEPGYQQGAADPRAQHEDDGLELLKDALDDLRRENLRLREARSSVTRQLGPLPISAAAIAGLLAAFPGHGSIGGVQVFLIVLAALAFLAMIGVSIIFSKLRPYRELRNRLERDWPWYAIPQASPARVIDEVRARSAPGEAQSGPPAHEAPASTRMRWYSGMIRVELTVRTGLEDGLDREWWALFAVRMLFGAVVLLLIAARLA